MYYNSKSISIKRSHLVQSRDLAGSAELYNIKTFLIVHFTIKYWSNSFEIAKF